GSEPAESARAREIGAEIKRRIRDEVGEWLSSSVGIGPNWLLAKTASNFRKPDGLFEIDRGNVREVLAEISLTDLCGIAERMAARMQLVGIGSPLDLYDLPPWELKRRLGIVGYYWHLRLHGYAIDREDWGTKSLGHSSVLPRPTADPRRLKPLLHKLCHRVARRLRREGWQAGALTISGTVVSGPAREWGQWGATARLAPTDRHHDIFGQAWQLLLREPPAGPLRKIAVKTYALRPADHEQPSLFDLDRRRGALSTGVDRANDRWGEFTVIPAGMLGSENLAGDAIAFGQDLKLQRETAAD
ncbi:MAG: hypothetical protein U1D32_01130, partial [Patescibacteria group bacterium]|nr:hypothetical protein [Patescibacteria group bacterium]